VATALITHPACLEHDTGPYHPETSERLRAVLAALDFALTAEDRSFTSTELRANIDRMLDKPS